MQTTAAHSAKHIHDVYTMYILRPLYTVNGLPNKEYNFAHRLCGDDTNCATKTILRVYIHTSIYSSKYKQVCLLHKAIIHIFSIACLLPGRESCTPSRRADKDGMERPHDSRLRSAEVWRRRCDYYRSYWTRCTVDALDCLVLTAV
jgi:hypothetical protein